MRETSLSDGPCGPFVFVDGKICPEALLERVSFALDHQKYLALPKDTVNRCKICWESLCLLLYLVLIKAMGIVNFALDPWIPHERTGWLSFFSRTAAWKVCFALASLLRHSWLWNVIIRAAVSCSKLHHICNGFWQSQLFSGLWQKPGSKSVQEPILPLMMNGPSHKSSKN